MSTYDTGIDPIAIKVAVLFLFCDSFVKFARIRAMPCGASSHDIASSVPSMHVNSPLEVFDWDMLPCILISTFQLLLYLAGTLIGAKLRFAAHLKTNYLVMCVLISSFGKGLYLLMMVWDYPLSFCNSIELFILSSNFVALRVYLFLQTIFTG